MEQDLLFDICGVVASVGMVLGYLPQAVETIRTRNTEGIALPTFLMIAVGGFAFMLQGLLHKTDLELCALLWVALGAHPKEGPVVAPF